MSGPRWRLRGACRPIGDKRWRLLVPAVCLAIGLLLSTTREVSHGDELRRSDNARLSDLVRTANAQVDGAQAQRDDLSNRIGDVNRGLGDSDSRVAAALDSIDDLTEKSGLHDVHGPGLTVSLTDATRGPDGTYRSDAAPEDLVVHQQDIQSVLNALWAGGAEAVQVQDQRITTASAPRCVGNTLLLGGRTYSPPYVMRAIGDAGALQRALDDEPGVRIYKQYVSRFGLGYRQSVSTDLSIIGYTPPGQMKYAVPLN